MTAISPEYPAAASHQAEAAHLAEVQARLLAWFRAFGRDLPWRRTRDPYAVLVAEMMLQQTQVERVRARWAAWLEQFPDLPALAAAPRAEVIRAWSGLGYNLRAVRLHEIATQVVARHGGRLPRGLADLLALKGIGRYTAGAVACFAYEQPVAMVDTNVRRVLGRVFLGLPEVPREREVAVRALADAAVPAHDAWAWGQALMDLGATVCTAARPACLVCPLLPVCRAAPAMSGWPAERQRRLREARATYATVPERQAADSQRVYRGRIVQALRALEPGQSLDLASLGPRVRPDYRPEHRPWLEASVRKLAADGLALVEDGPDGRITVRLP